MPLSIPHNPLVTYNWQEISLGAKGQAADIQHEEVLFETDREIPSVLPSLGEHLESFQRVRPSQQQSLPVMGAVGTHTSMQNTHTYHIWAWK